MTEIIVQVEVSRWGKAGRYFEQIGESIEKMHTHDNKAHLDTIDEEKMSEINDAIDKRHTHNNKAQLNLIDENKLKEINDGIDKKHSHSNKAQLDKIDEDLVKKLLVAAGNIDNHENRELLDKLGVDENGNPTYEGKAIVTERPTASMVLNEGYWMSSIISDSVSIAIYSWEEILPPGTEIKTIKIKYYDEWIDIHEIYLIDFFPNTLHMSSVLQAKEETEMPDAFVFAVIGKTGVYWGAVATALIDQQIEEIEIVYYTDGGEV